MLYELLNLIFHFLHLFLISFNLLGWMYKPFRRCHLIVILGTFSSWVGLGYFRGWGYCPLTDWHWQIKETMGEENIPHSYIYYLFQNTFGLHLEVALIDGATLLFALLALIASLVMNTIDALNRKKSSKLF